MLHDLWNCLHWPFCPGVLIAVLAFLTAAVAFRIENAKRVEKTIWTVVFLLLVVGEIWMMGVDRAKHDQEQARARTEQLQKFQDIADRIENSNKKNQEHFDAEMKRIEALVESTSRIAQTASKSLDQITGKGQFCYLMPMLNGSNLDGHPPFPLIKINSGSVPLDVCHVVVTYRTVVGGNRMDFLRALFDEEVGPIPPRNLLGVGNSLHTNMSLMPGDYWVEIHTRNDRFWEQITISDSLQTGVVMKIRVTNQQNKVVYSYDYPMPKPSKQETTK